jgi:hypothetical protein
MARKKSDGDSVSLFPFMSILVCLIGSLTLMIAALMAGQMNSEQSQETIERYQRYSEIMADVEAEKTELDSLRKLLADAERIHKDLQAALEEAALLDKKQKELLTRVDENTEYGRLLAEANRLRKRVADLEPEPARLQEMIKKLEEEAARKKAGPEEAIVQIRPGGSGVDIEPTFIECTATGLVVHEGAEPQRIRTGDIGNETLGLPRLLAKVAAAEKGQVIFLVRPDGVDVYNAARNFARGYYTVDGYAKNGKLPVPSQGNIDLIIFRK